MMAAGRLGGDRLADRFGPVALGRFCAATALVGVVALVAANGLPLALFGFAAIGLGVSVGFPLSSAPPRNVATGRRRSTWRRCR